MPYCKFCGESVPVSPVYHPECWEKEAKKIAELFCDGFCKWPHLCQSEDELQTEHCDKDCPLLKMLNLGL